MPTEDMKEVRLAIPPCECNLAFWPLFFAQGVTLCPSDKHKLPFRGIRIVFSRVPLSRTGILQSSIAAFQ